MFDYYPAALSCTGLPLSLRSSLAMIFMDQTSAGKLAPPGSQEQSWRKLRMGSAPGSSALRKDAEKTKADEIQTIIP